jgi:hypothetical protein
VPLAVLMVTMVSTELGLLKVTANTAGVPSATAGALAMETVGVSLALMVFCTVAVPRVAALGALMFRLKVSAGSAMLSSMIKVLTCTAVTPAGMVIKPLTGTATKVLPPSTE